MCKDPEGNGRCVYISCYRHLTEDEQNNPEERENRESYGQMIQSMLGSPASTQDLKRITQLLNLNCVKMMMGMGFPMPRNARMNQLLSHMTHTLVLRQFCQKVMTLFLELSSQESRILKDSPSEKLIRIQSWTQGSTMFNSQMVRMQNWEQISLQNTCMLNVMLEVTNTGLWIILLTIEGITMQFAKISKMSQ